jgi:hypothetical protein
MSMFKIATATTLCIWALLLVQSAVDAHAALYQPVQRIHSGECAHCGGISQVSGNGGGPDAYPGTIMPLKGPCGEHQHNTPQKGVGYQPTDSYPVDGVIDVELYWNAPHGTLTLTLALTLNLNLTLTFTFTLRWLAFLSDVPE